MIPNNNNINKLPRILLITDSFPLKNGMGISQTIFNLFEKYPLQNVLLYSPLWLDFDKSNALDCQQIFYKRDLINPVKNRLGKFFNPIIKKVNDFYLSKFYQPSTVISNFKLDIVFVLPNAIDSALIALNVNKI